MVNGTAGEIDLNLVEKGHLVESLWHAVDHATGDLASIPGLVKRVMETGAWRERVQRGKTYKHERFIDFITTKPLAGCGWPPEKVEALIKDEPEILTLWRKATTGKHGGDHSKTDNVSLEPRHGNSRAYTLDRLQRERFDLYERVIAKELSVNAAAIEAGWRKKPTALEALQKAWNKATETERAAFRATICHP